MALQPNCFAPQEESHPSQSAGNRITRVVRVFSAHMQFVEFKVEGAQLKSRTVALPRETLSSIRDKRTRERMKTTFKLVPENSSISGDQIKAAANDIRERYLVHHKIYGSVMLKAKLRMPRTK
jgi:hypothetical protein